MIEGRLNMTNAMQGASPAGESSYIKELFSPSRPLTPGAVQGTVENPAVKELLVAMAAEAVAHAEATAATEISCATREKKDAIPYDLVPYQEMTDAFVRVAEFGAKKYDAWNWSLGLKRVQILSSLLRHTFAYLRGEERDRESGLLHTDHILWNAAVLSHNVHWNLEDGRRAEPTRSYKDRV